MTTRHKWWIPWYTGGRKGSPQKVYLQKLHSNPDDNIQCDLFIQAMSGDVILSREDAEKIHAALYHYSKYVEQTNGGIKSTKLHDAFDILEAAMKGAE